MEYMTVQIAAQNWNISERLVQQYCVDGRIEGAKKFGTSWAIPTGTQKPPDLRKRKHYPHTSAASSPAASEHPPHRTPMPLLNTAFPPGHCLEYIEAIQDSPSKDIALAEYHYFSGHSDEAAQLSELYLTHSDPALRLSACLIYAYSNLSLGQIHQARRALAELKAASANTNENTPPPLRALALSFSTIAAVLLHLPLPEGADSLPEQIRLLPPGLQIFGLYALAHQIYLQGNYEKSIGIVEAAFALQRSVFPIPSIYLHLVAVMDYISLKQPEEAQRHLLAAWTLAQPDDLIEGFGEHHGLLGGMLEAVLKKDWPEDFQRIIAITYRFSAGWRRVHNPVTGDDVADNLTTTEFAIAMLATRGWTNQEIANHLCLSLNTVKQYISITLQKLNIKQRKDLKQFMLR